MNKLEIKQRLTTLAMLAATPGLAMADPQGANVVAGAATISQPSTQGTVINQGSAKAIINWQSFSIGTNEFVQFNQPDASSVSLNRVVGADPSSILGNLSANGQVFLVNPNGVFFGEGASLDVGGLVASTLDIDNDDFLNGNYVFTKPSSVDGNSIVNAGVIQARESGYVVLMGDRVENSGSIKTTLGQIALLAGGEVTLDINGDGLVSYSIDSAAATELAGVDNSGELIADGGRVILAGKVSDALVATAVNNSGLIQANGIEERNGEIFLTGSSDVYNTGTISASGESGGSISIQGKRVAQQGEVHADATQGHGGNVSITADEIVALTQTSLTTANAGNQGDGGDVIAYTTGSAIFKYGARIEAKGGTESGDGGFVEVSGLENVEINGFVDASASNGAAGTFLIDPTDITIVSADDAMVPDLTDPGMGDPRVFSNDDSNNNEILDTTIEALLDGGTSVTLETASSGMADGDITVDAQIDKAAGGAATLTLKADDDIILNQDIVSTTGTLGVVLEANGNVTFNTGADIISNGGDVTITADMDASTNNEIISMASDSIINAGAGAINLNADGDIALGQLTTSSTVTVVTGNGAITDANTTTNNITGSTVTLTSDSGIGAGDALETAATSLDASVLGTGDIELAQTGGVDLAGIDTNDGSIMVTASGAVTTSADVIATDGDVSITTSSNGAITLSNDVTATTSANGDDVSLTITAGGAGVLTQNAMTAIRADANGDDANATLNLTGGSIALNGTTTSEIEDTTGGAVEEAQLTLTAGSGGLTTTGSLLANVKDDGNARIAISSGASSTIGGTATANVVDDGDVSISIDSTASTVINAAILAETGGANSTGNASITLDGDTAVDINSAVTAYVDDDGNASVTIGGTGAVTIGAAVSSTVDGNGDASIDIGSIGTEVASATIEAAGSLALTEGSSGDSETLSVYSAGAINTGGGSLNANDGITLSGASISVAGLTSSTGTVSVTADTGDIVTTAINADAISITNTGATNGDVTTGQVDADNGGITVNAAGALSSGANTVIATGAIDLDGDSVVTGNIDSSGSTVDVDAAVTSIAVGTIDADDGITLNAASSLDAGAMTISNSGDVSATAGTTIGSVMTPFGSITGATNISFSAGGLVSTGTNVYTADRINLSGTGMTGASYNIDTDTADLRLTGGIASATVDNTAYSSSMTPAAITFSGSGFASLDIDTDEDTNVSGALSSTATVDIDSGSGALDIANSLSADNGITLTSTGALSTVALNAENIAGATVTLSGDTVTTGNITTKATTGIVSVTGTASSGMVISTGNIDAGTVTLDAPIISAGAITANSFTIQDGMANATDLTLTGTLTNNASLTLSGSLDVQAINATTGISLTANDISAGALTTTTGAVTAVSTTAALGTGSVSADSISLTANGGSGSISTGQLTTDVGAITLTSAGTVSSGASSVTATTSVGISGSSITTGDISATAVGLDAATIDVDAVTATAGLSVLNADDFTSGGTINNGGVALSISTTNSIDTQAITNAASVTLTSDTVSTGDLTAASGNVAVTANNGTADTGSITANSGSVNVSANSGATTIVGNVSAGTGITLSGAGVSASAGGNLTTTTGNIVVSVPMGDANGISLGNLLATAGTVSVDADMGDATVGDVNAISGTISGENVSVGSVVGNIGVMASNLSLGGTYTNGTFSATNTLTLDTTGVINNSNVSLTGTDVNIDGTINALATGAEQDASVTINASNDLSISGTVTVSSQSGNATFAATADSDGDMSGDFNQTAAGAITVTASNTLIGSPTPEAGTGNTSINIAGASVQQLGSLTTNASNGTSATYNPTTLLYTPIGAVANQSTITLTSTVGDVETNTITSNYSADGFFGAITGTESISIDSVAAVTVGGTIQTSNTASTESVSITAAGNVDGAGTISSDSASITTTGDIGRVSDSLNIDASSVVISGALSNAWLGLDRVTSTLNLGSGITNTLDITAAGDLSLAGTTTATDIILDVAGSASDGGNVLTASSVTLNGAGNYGTTAARFDIAAADINIDEAVSSAAINSSAVTTNLNFINTGHGDIDVTGSSDLSVTASASISANTFTTNTSGNLDIQQDISTTTPLVLTANGITSGSNVLTASSITLSGTGSSNVDIDTDTATVNLGSGINNVTLDTTAAASVDLNLNAVSFGAVTVNSDALAINGTSVTTGNVDIDATGDVSINATLNTGNTVTLDTSGQLINNAEVNASSIVIGATTAVSAMSGAGQYKAATVTINATSPATVNAVTNTGVLNVNGGSNLDINNNAFVGSTAFTFGATNYTSLDLKFGGSTSLLGSDITATMVNINGQSALNLNQAYTASMINLTAGGQVNVGGVLTAPSINLVGNGAASFGSSASKLMTNANNIDLGVGISDVFIDNAANTGNATLNFSGSNYGVVDFDFGGTASQVGTATTSTVQGNDFLASALALSANGNLVVTNGFDVNGGTVPGVLGDTLLTAAIASVGSLVNAGGSSDPNASFISTDAVTLNINNLSQSNQYLLIKADDITFTGTSDASNLLVQLTPFTINQTDMLGNTTFSSLSLNKSTPGTADFNYTFDDHYAPFTGTTIALGEQGFDGAITIGTLNAAAKNLLFLSGGTITGFDNIIGTGLLGTADELGGFFVVRPVVTTITADQLGVFGFKFGARVSTIEVNNNFDATGEDDKNKNDLEVENGGVNDGSEKQCS